jgi:hypothetical protein
MADKEKEPLEKRVQQAILQEAFFRWESAAVISISLLMAVFGPQFISFVPSWAWLLGGLGAELALVYSSLTDPEFGRKVAAGVLRHEFQPERLKDKELRRQVDQALDYRSRIEKAIRERSDSLLKVELSETAGQMDEWLENIYDLAQRIDRYKVEQKNLNRDKQQAETRISELQHNMAIENNPDIKQQMQITLDGLLRQLDTLDLLEDTIRRANLQLENSLSSLGTIYSQTMLVDAKDIDSGRARRLRQEIADEVTELHDILIAMDEVHSAEGSV